jgi:restriction system protein
MGKKNESAPEFVKFMGPIIEALLRLGGSGRPEEVRAEVVRALSIPDEEQAKRIPSGVQSRFENQVHWARFYLAKDGYIESSQRGVWVLAAKARELKKPDLAYWRDVYRRVVAVMRGVGLREEAVVTAEAGNLDLVPAEQSTPTYSYPEQVLRVLRALSPNGFERFCQMLLRESGFEEVTVTGRSGDGGIDGHGVLKVNPFVTFRVLFQCKRYAESGSVSASQIRDFRGAMLGRADKGIILTTSAFTRDAEKEAKRDGVPAIELVDGDQLVEMMRELKLGLKPVTTFAVDDKFFQEFGN